MPTQLRPMIRAGGYGFRDDNRRVVQIVRRLFDIDSGHTFYETWDVESGQTAVVSQQEVTPHALANAVRVTTR